MPTSHNFHLNSVNDNSSAKGEAQRLTSVPRIIATHWLRDESMEVEHA